jgi:hypothetical protein
MQFAFARQRRQSTPDADLHRDGAFLDGRDINSIRYFALKVKLTVAGFPTATVTV